MCYLKKKIIKKIRNKYMIIGQIFHLTVYKPERGDGFALKVGEFYIENLKPFSLLECFF